MIIHNFFSDALLSVVNVLENYIFRAKPYFYHTNVSQQTPSNYLKSVQFNIGSKNYQIGDYKQSAQLEFPSAILSLISDESAFGKYNPSIGHHSIMDINEILGTYNVTTGRKIILREEQTVIYLTCQINCESQLQANEVAHQVKRFLPPQKYIQIAPFSSFMEVPDYFWDEKENNPNKHEIKNLFQLYDDTTGGISYYFLVHYKPILRLNSAQVDIQESGQRSYSVMCDFNYLIQMPLFLFDVGDRELIERINIGFTTSDNPSSIVLDYNYMSTLSEPRIIGEKKFRNTKTFFIDYSSDNFHSDKVVIPIDNFNPESVVEISKVANSAETSTFYVDLNGSNKAASRDSKFLKENESWIYDSEKKLLTVFLDEEMRPALTGPIIIGVLEMYTDEELTKIENQKFKNVKIYYPVENNKFGG